MTLPKSKQRHELWFASNSIIEKVSAVELYIP